MVSDSKNSIDQSKNLPEERELKGIPASAGIAICSQRVTVIKKLRETKNRPVSPDRLPSENRAF